jgi:hypothetical protein
MATDSVTISNSLPLEFKNLNYMGPVNMTTIEFVARQQPRFTSAFGYGKASQFFFMCSQIGENVIPRRDARNYKFFGPCPSGGDDDLSAEAYAAVIIQDEDLPPAEIQPRPRAEYVVGRGDVETASEAAVEEGTDGKVVGDRIPGAAVVGDRILGAGVAIQGDDLPPAESLPPPPPPPAPPPRAVPPRPPPPRAVPPRPGAPRSAPTLR